MRACPTTFTIQEPLGLLELSPRIVLWGVSEERSSRPQALRFGPHILPSFRNGGTSSVSGDFLRRLPAIDIAQPAQEGRRGKTRLGSISSSPAPSDRLVECNMLDMQRVIRPPHALRLLCRTRRRNSQQRPALLCKPSDGQEVADAQPWERRLRKLPI